MSFLIGNIKSLCWAIIPILLTNPVIAMEPFSEAQTSEFMLALATFVEKNHLKKDPASMQKGMVYEYRDMRKKSPPECFVQGEALDTMHDGAWLAAALVHARIAKDEPLYKDLLEKYLLPFYCRMLNHSHEIFSNKVNHARPSAQDTWKNSREWLLQDGEKGFVPYWWDEGYSVSLERLRDKNPLPAFPSFDDFIHQKRPNPNLQLSGYSLGSSNHLAQDLAVMLQLSWLLYRNLEDKDGDCYRAELLDASRHLQECRMRHHGPIAMVDAAAGVAHANAALLRQVPDQSKFEIKLLNNHYRQCLESAEAGKRLPTPGFADDQEYRYYSALARHGTLPKAVAFKLVYDALTEGRLYQYYCDDQDVPAGMNRFDLHPIYFTAGKPLDYRSDRKGPGGKPRPAGSRLGPQNMVVCGWSCQALNKWPELWTESIGQLFGKLPLVAIHHPNMDPSPAKFTTFNLENQPLELSASLNQLTLRIPNPPRQLDLQILSADGSQGCNLKLKNMEIQGTNLLSEKIQLEHRWQNSSNASILQVEIPFTVRKGQTAWLNGVELGKYQLSLAGKKQEFVLATQPAHVKMLLQRELVEGLATWQRVFKEKGYLPTGLDAGGDWDHYSDSGAYAHLICACAQHLHLLHGKQDWETLRLPAILEDSRK